MTPRADHGVQCSLGRVTNDKKVAGRVLVSDSGVHASEKEQAQNISSHCALCPDLTWAEGLG